MSEPLLRLFDGYPHTSPELRDAVRELQAVLRRYDPAMVMDGLFGAGTERTVRALQKAHGLRADGVVGPETWQVLMSPDATGCLERFATSYPLDHPILLEDLEAAARYGAPILDAAAETGIPPAVVAALGSRQSRWGLALNPQGPEGSGDFTPRPFRPPERQGTLPADGRGFERGLMGLDYDRHEFARNGDWRDPAENIRYACRVLCDARALLRRRTVLCGQALLRGALAAYNCGVENVLRAVRLGCDVDFYTAGRDFSRELLNRAGFFAAHGWD